MVKVTTVVNEPTPDLRLKIPKPYSELVSMPYIDNLLQSYQKYIKRSCIQSKKRGLMSIFKKKKLDTKDKEINDLSWKVRLLKDEVDSLVNTIKEHKLSSLTYPYVKIYTCLDDYQEEKEKYQSKGYTLSGCCCNYEVWVKKGDKHE